MGQQAEPICAVRSSSLEEGINACSAEAYGLLETLKAIHDRLHGAGQEKNRTDAKPSVSFAQRPFETEEILRQCRDITLKIVGDLFN